MKFTGCLLLTVLTALTIASASEEAIAIDRSSSLLRSNGHRLVLRSEERQLIVNLPDERQNGNANGNINTAIDNPIAPANPGINIPHNPNRPNVDIAQGDCTIQVAVLMQIPDAEPLAEEEIFECEMDPRDANGKTGLTRKLALTSDQKGRMKQLWLEGNLNPGKSKLQLQGREIGFDTQEVKVPTSLMIEDAIDRPGNGNGNNGNGNNGIGIGSLNKVTENSADDAPRGTADSADEGDISIPASDRSIHRNQRRLQNGGVTGTKPILVVKVYDRNGLARDESPAKISDDIFGTGIDHNDEVNAKSQLYACSMGQLNIVPGSIPSGKASATGVIEVEIGISLSNARGDIRNEVTAEVQDYLGFSLPGPYEQVMYVLEGCYQDCGWAAYAFVNSWLSVYQGNFYRYPAIQIHELGHNFGFAHSGGLDQKTYTDHTCLMGNPLYSDETGKMCFNPAKNWQIGWYDSRRETVYPRSEADDWAENFVMVGIADYENEGTNNLPVVLKLETGGSQDYFLGFNRAIGVNADNDQADDEVTIVQVNGGSGNSYAQSFLQATLKQGQSHTIDGFGGSSRNIVIQVLNIEESDSSPWKATIRVGTDEAPPAPTPSPTSSTPMPTDVPSVSFVPSLSQLPSEEPSISMLPSLSKTPTASPINPLTNVGNNGSPSAAFPLGECEGDCDNDGECEGELVCYQRDAQEAVPGCFGTGSSGSDYCCDRSKFQTELWIRGDELPPGSYGLCEGDCDTDEDCIGSLQCLQRSSSNPVPVPGCTGEDNSGNDYCYGNNPPTASPTIKPTSAPTTSEPTSGPSKQPTSLPTSSPSKKPTASPETQNPTSGPSKQPTSSPNKDPTTSPSKQPSSSPSLKPSASPSKKPTSSPRTASPNKDPTTSPTKIPSSSPSKIPTSSPSKKPTSNPSKNPTSSPTAKPTVSPSTSALLLVEVGNNGSPSSEFPLGLCEGDCDDDTECDGDLRCFQRDGIEPVPGCSGTGDSAWDYCYDRSRFPYQIILKENNLGRDSYGLCEGDCDQDSDCIGDLKCYQRSGSNRVVGCDGDDNDGNDFCAV